MANRFQHIRDRLRLRFEAALPLRDLEPDRERERERERPVIAFKCYSYKKNSID